MVKLLIDDRTTVVTCLKASLEAVAMASMSSDSSRESWSNDPESNESSKFVPLVSLPLGNLDFGDNFGLDVCKGPMLSLILFFTDTGSVFPGLAPPFGSLAEGLIGLGRLLSANGVGECMGGSGLLVKGLGLVGELRSRSDTVVGEGELRGGGGAGALVDPPVCGRVGNLRDGDPLAEGA